MPERSHSCYLEARCCVVGNPRCLPVSLSRVDARAQPKKWSFTARGCCNVRPTDHSTSVVRGNSSPVSSPRGRTQSCWCSIIAFLATRRRRTVTDQKPASPRFRLLPTRAGNIREASTVTQMMPSTTKPGGLTRSYHDGSTTTVEVRDCSGQPPREGPARWDTPVTVRVRHCVIRLNRMPDGRKSIRLSMTDGRISCWPDRSARVQTPGSLTPIAGGDSGRLSLHRDQHPPVRRRSARWMASVDHSHGTKSSHLPGSSDHGRASRSRRRDGSPQPADRRHRRVS